MKIIRIILWVIIVFTFLLGLVYFFTGSLEWFPTPEQQDKARTVSIAIMAVPSVCGIVMFLTRKK